MHDEHKRFVSYPEFWNDIHNDSQGGTQLKNLEERANIKIPKQNTRDGFAYSLFEKMEIRVESFWDLFNKRNINDIYEQLRGYFKCSPEERKNHFLKKILTNDFINISGVLNANFDKSKYNDRGDYIKESMKRLFEETVYDQGGETSITNPAETDKVIKNKIEFIYYTLGEFFDGVFIGILGKDNIKKYYEDNNLKSDLFRDETEHKEGSNAQPKQQIPKNETNKLINKKSIKGDQLIDEKITKQAHNLQFYKKGFWISLGITIVFGLGSGAAAILSGILWFIAMPGTGVIVTGYFLWKFYKNKLEHKTPNDFSTNGNCKDYYNLKGKHDERNISLDLNKKTEIKQKILNNYKKPLSSDKDNSLMF